MLIVTTQFSRFDKTKERPDVLALDKNGKLVIIEIKRDDSGRYVDLQAIKYAAHCSTFDYNRIIELRKEYLLKNGKKKTHEEIKTEIDLFISNEEFENIDDIPRIILASKDFRPEVVSTVMWLTQKVGMDITCINIKPHIVDSNTIDIVSNKIIPIPEAEYYLIKAKEKEVKTITRTQEEYQKFFSDVFNELDKRLEISVGSPKPHSWNQIRIGIGGIHYELAFHGRPRSSFAVEIHFEKSIKEENISLLNSLKKLKNKLEKELGEKVIFDGNWGKNWTRLVIEKNEGKMTKELKKWAVEKTEILYSIVQPHLNKLK